MNLEAFKRPRRVKWCEQPSRNASSPHFSLLSPPSFPSVTWWVWEWWMWDDLSKISIALHKSGVPPRPRLNWTLGCLEILEQKRRTNHCCYSISHCVGITCTQPLIGPGLHHKCFATCCTKSSKSYQSHHEKNILWQDKPAIICKI